MYRSRARDSQTGASAKPVARHAWSSLWLLLPIGAVVAAFAVHPATDWLVFGIAPPLFVGLSAALVAVRAADTALRLTLGAVAAFCGWWLCANAWATAQDFAQLPRDLPVNAVYDIGADRGCSATVFDLAQGTSSAWSGRGATVWLPRWPSLGATTIEHHMEALSNLPKALRHIRELSEDRACGLAVLDDEWRHEISSAWRYRFSHVGQAGDAAVLVVLRQRAPYVVVLRPRA